MEARVFSSSYVRLRRASNSASQSSMLTGWALLLLQEQPSHEDFVLQAMIGQVGEGGGGGAECDSGARPLALGPAGGGEGVRMKEADS